MRKSREGEVTADLYAFLTTEPNAVAAPIHLEAMPVILTTDEEFSSGDRALRVEAVLARRKLDGAYWPGGDWRA